MKQAAVNEQEEDKNLLWLSHDAKRDLILTYWIELIGPAIVRLGRAVPGDTPDGTSARLLQCR